MGAKVSDRMPDDTPDEGFQQNPGIEPHRIVLKKYPREVRRNFLNSLSGLDLEILRKVLSGQDFEDLLNTES